MNRQLLIECSNQFHWWVIAHKSRGGHFHTSGAYLTSARLPYHPRLVTLPLRAVLSFHRPPGYKSSIRALLGEGRAPGIIPESPPPPQHGPAPTVPAKDSFSSQYPELAPELASVDLKFVQEFDFRSRYSTILTSNFAAGVRTRFSLAARISSHELTSRCSSY